MSVLKGILAEIAELIDEQTALKVAAAKGGTRAYFSTNPRQDHWLSQAVGQENATIIANHIAMGSKGVEILIPMGPNATTIAKWQKIRQMLEQGYSKSAIALAVGVHEKTVQNHKNGKIKTAEQLVKQTDLFDEL